LRLIHQAFKDTIKIKISQSAIQVVRTPNWSTWFHACKAGNCLTGQRSHHRVVTLTHRLKEHLGHLFRRHCLAATTGSGSPSFGIHRNLIVIGDLWQFVATTE
jgi:hypothetical protein